METIIIRKYATIEKLMHLSEDELTELETIIAHFSSEDTIDIEQYNRELEKADAEINQGKFYTHEQAIKRLNAWKKQMRIRHVRQKPLYY